jgi:Putative phage abortive infection protein
MMPRLKTSYFIVLCALVFCWIVIIIASGAGWNPFTVSWNFANSGSFGDSFGPLSAFMAAAAAFSAIATFQEQRREIRRLQERERVEDKRRDTEQTAQEKFRRQEEIVRQEQRDEMTFFQLLGTFQKIVGETDIVSSNKTTIGRDAFKSILLSFQNRLMVTENIEFAWIETATRHQNDLNHYFRLMYHIVVFVDQSNLRDKSRYAKILRALLSESELILLALNCANGEGKEKFKPLVEKYALLHSLSEAAQSRWNISKGFDTSAFGS